MAASSRIAIAGTFFITAIAYNRRRLFHVEARAKLFIETLQHYRAEGLYKLYAFVVMGDVVDVKKEILANYSRSQNIRRLRL
jgi:putative transposase